MQLKLTDELRASIESQYEAKASAIPAEHTEIVTNRALPLVITTAGDIEIKNVQIVNKDYISFTFDQDLDIGEIKKVTVLFPWTDAQNEKKDVNYAVVSGELSKIISEIREKLFTTYKSFPTE